VRTKMNKKEKEILSNYLSKIGKKGGSSKSEAKRQAAYKREAKKREKKK